MLRGRLAVEGGQCMGVVIVTKEWGVGVASLTMTSSNKKFNSLKNAKKFLCRASANFNFDYMYKHSILSGHMRMRNLMFVRKL